MQQAQAKAQCKVDLCVKSILLLLLQGLYIDPGHINHVCPVEELVAPDVVHPDEIGCLFGVVDLGGEEVEEDAC